MLPIMFSMDEPDDRYNFVKGLFDDYSPILFKKAKEFVLKDEDAEDILQEAFVSVITHADRLREIPFEKQAAYLYTVVRNKCYNHLNAKKRSLWRLFEGDPDEAIDQFEGAPSPETLFLLSESKTSIDWVYEQLTEEEQVLFDGKYTLEQSNQELARLLGIKPTTLATRLMRLRRKVLRLLEESTHQDV